MTFSTALLSSNRPEITFLLFEQHFFTSPWSQSASHATSMQFLVQIQSCSHQTLQLCTTHSPVLSSLTWSSTVQSAALCPSLLSAALCSVWAGGVEPVVLGVAALLCNPANSPELQRKQKLQFSANSSSEVTKQEFFKSFVNLDKAVGSIFNAVIWEVIKLNASHQSWQVTFDT